MPVYIISVVMALMRKQAHVGVFDPSELDISCIQEASVRVRLFDSMISSVAR